MSHAHYSVERVLQNTLLGHLYLARKNNHERVVLKYSDLTKLSNSSLCENPKNEVSVMKYLQMFESHLNIVRFHESFEVEAKSVDIPSSIISSSIPWPKDKHLVQVYEYIQGEELFSAIDRSKSGLGEKLSQDYFLQMLDAVSSIHRRGIVHLDISAENFMIGPQNCIKLIDFGMSQVIPVSGKLHLKDKFPGKINYVAPEIYAGQEFTAVSADLYSLGIVLYVMLFGHPLYAVPSNQDSRFSFVQQPGGFSNIIRLWKLTASIEVVDLLGKMIRMPADRISWEDLYKHPWLTKKFD